MTEEKTEAEQLRELLAAVLDALTLPHDAEDRDFRLEIRAAAVRAVLPDVLDVARGAGDPGWVGWNAGYLRKRLASEDAANAGEESPS